MSNTIQTPIVTKSPVNERALPIPESKISSSTAPSNDIG